MQQIEAYIATLLEQGKGRQESARLMIQFNDERAALKWSLRVSSTALEIRALRAELQGDMVKSESLLTKAREMYLLSSKV
jgi:hypothetical protein